MIAKLDVQSITHQGVSQEAAQKRDEVQKVRTGAKRKRKGQKKESRQNRKLRRDGNKDSVYSKVKKTVLIF